MNLWLKLWNCLLYTSGASKEEKQERIIIQKWIANWPLGNEAWADYRRTGSVSYTHLEQADRNLKELGNDNLETLVQKGQDAWNKVLGRIDVEGRCV